MCEILIHRVLDTPQGCGHFYLSAHNYCRTQTTPDLLIFDKEEVQSALNDLWLPKITTGLLIYDNAVDQTVLYHSEH